VTPEDTSSVFAIHLGGDEHTGWGVRVDGLDERDAVCDVPGSTSTKPGAPAQLPVECVPLDRDHQTVEVPDFLPPDLRQMDSTRLAALDLHRHGMSLSLEVDTATPVDPFGAWSVTPQIGVSREVWSPSFGLMTTALAVRIAAGPTFGQLRSPVVVPGRFEEDPLSGTAKLPFGGAASTASLEIHLARLSPLGMFAGAGIHGAWLHTGDVPDRPDSISWGPNIRVGIRWPLIQGISGTAHLSLTYQQIPVAATPNGCHGPSVPRDSVWDLWGGAGLGIEVDP
jgi:hypothetical protein